MIDLQKAIEARDKYLEERPHLKVFQEEIDDILSKCTEDDKLSVITLMMSAKLLEFQDALLKLKKELENAQGS
jgi:hypothetical protein